MVQVAEEVSTFRIQRGAAIVDIWWDESNSLVELLQENTIHGSFSEVRRTVRTIREVPHLHLPVHSWGIPAYS